MYPDKQYTDTQAGKRAIYRNCQRLLVFCSSAWPIVACNAPSIAIIEADIGFVLRVAERSHWKPHDKRFVLWGVVQTSLRPHL